MLHRRPPGFAPACPGWYQLANHARPRHHEESRAVRHWQVVIWMSEKPLALSQPHTLAPGPRRSRDTLNVMGQPDMTRLLRRRPWINLLRRFCCPPPGVCWRGSLRNVVFLSDKSPTPNNLDSYTLHAQGTYSVRVLPPLSLSLGPLSHIVGYCTGVEYVSLSDTS